MKNTETAVLPLGAALLELASLRVDEKDDHHVKESDTCEILKTSETERDPLMDLVRLILEPALEHVVVLSHVCPELGHVASGFLFTVLVHPHFKTITN
jgi:hypothetical protein